LVGDIPQDCLLGLEHLPEILGVGAHDLTLLETLGWISIAVSVWMIATPGVLRRFVGERLLGASDSVLRTRGILAVGFGGFLGWAALVVL
jgi:hypothetical protein